MEKKSRIAKTILHNKRTSRGITIPDIILYYRVTVMKTAQYWHKNREVDKWNQIEHPGINPQTYEHSIFDKGAKSIYNGRKKASLTTGAGITGCQSVEE